MSSLIFDGNLLVRQKFATCLTFSLLAGCAGIGGGTLDDVPTVDDIAIASDQDAAAIAAPANETGFFGRFFNRSDDDASNAPAEEGASATDEVATPAAGGFFGRLLGGGETTQETAAPGTVPPMTVLPFGEVGTTCGLSKRDMGTKIADVSGYTIYDTAPNTTAPRPHYITGLDDRCARQFTAALVLTGDVGTHEIVRYETAQSRRPYSGVDNAYEAIKASYCRAGHGKPCGGRIDALARNTVFVTGYERFTSSPVWVEILLHDGNVAAVGVERE